MTSPWQAVLPFSSQSPNGMNMNPCGMHPMFALDVPGPFPAPQPTEADPARNISPTTFKASRPPAALGRRRSVRSMKNLLPLTLPSNSQPTSTYSRPISLATPLSSQNRPPSYQPHHQNHQHHHCQQQQQQQQQQQHHLRHRRRPDHHLKHLCIPPGTMVEAAEPTMDCNLPELLAQDLEFSNLVFAAKNMTAGAPSPDLASDEEDWPSAEPPTVYGASCHPNGVPQFQPLGAIDEKSSASGASEHDLSDAASSASGASFSEAEYQDDDAAASPQIRQQSIMTADTTVYAVSEPPTIASHRRLVSFCDGSEEQDDTGNPESWMDLESEGPADHPELGKSLDQSPVATPIKPVRPLSRLGDKSINESPPRAKSAHAATRRLSNPFDGYTRPASRALSLQVDPTTAAAKEQNRLSFDSLHSIDIAVPTRTSSLKHRVSSGEEARKSIASRSRARSHTSSSRAGSDHVVAPGANRSSIIADLKEELEPWFRYIDDHEGLAPPLLITPRPVQRSTETPRSVPTPRPRSQAQNRSRPTSAASASYAWLENPAEMHSTSSDDNRRIPLPPNVIESLRISVTCFPETMLLSSSLSIETIRNYSRKIRHPVQEPIRPETPPASPKRWKWLASRRNNVNPSRHCSRTPSSSNVDLASMPPSTATLTPPQWSRIRNLFPTGSDYLCDALYAHIVAYNYLLPLAQSAARPVTPATPETSPGGTDDSIPKKAAFLLGLHGLQETTPPPPPPPPRPLRKRSSMFLSLRGTASRQSFMPSIPATPAPAPEIPLRDLLIGLRRCIARLVATLRAEASDGLLAGDPVNEIDPLIMRSLCEIVRCCEDTPANDRAI
ncbi:uncharacterized protein CTRU02_207169 [Colletotrichum truncatum]|uniref:Uncharacterized protein n=1 Tax=Colletotrichum truncatum TaxID=5467 RepID=A0ACC3Z021_COLTU|nr:uncharacterized protein CTRU02_01201 [Colletotrichum truncatum]KAF6800796.1 hypothetical protein CTRU02_01201 [Colletotrichum truncatum]